MSSSPDLDPTPPSHPAPHENLVRELRIEHGDDLNIWDQVESHRGSILDDAKRRRRITPQRLSPSKGQFLYTFSRGGRVIGGLDGRHSTLVSHQSRRAAQSRQVMRQYLNASDVPIAPGYVFSAAQAAAAEKYAAGFSRPVIVRPASRQVTDGATADVEGAQAFRSAWEKASEACNGLRPLDHLIEVEAPSEGLLLRFYVVRETAWAAVVRIPLHVIGDGTSDLASLLQSEGERRRKCVYLKKNAVTRDMTQLVAPETDLLSVPDGGAVVFPELDPLANLSGALNSDVLDSVSQELKGLAIDAMWAFPGLAATAVDIVTPSLDAADGAVVVDVNPGADISEFLYPAYGRPRRVGLAILDQMIATSR